MASVNVHCPRCQSALVYRHGQSPKGSDTGRDPTFKMNFPDVE